MLFRRYKILKAIKAIFGLWSLLLFVYHVPRDNERESEEKQKLDALQKALDEELSDPNPNIHFFVSCGGFV